MSGDRFVSIVAYQIAENLTHRPGWSFEATSRGVRIQIEGPNSHPEASTERITLHVDCPIPPDMDLSTALELVSVRIEGIEAHERAEWLRYDGKCVSKEARRAHPGRHYPPM